MVQKIIINTKIPSLNEYINANRKNWMIGARIKREIEDVILWELLVNKTQKVQNYPISLQITFYEANSRRDSDNITAGVKFIFDALKKAKIIIDDGPNYIPQPPICKIERKCKQDWIEIVITEGLNGE